MKAIIHFTDIVKHTDEVFCCKHGFMEDLPSLARRIKIFGDHGHERFIFPHYEIQCNRKISYSKSQKYKNLKILIFNLNIIC